MCVAKNILSHNHSVSPLKWAEWRPTEAHLSGTTPWVRVGEMPLQTASEFRAEIRSVVVGLGVAGVVRHIEAISDETARCLIETDTDEKPQNELN